MTNEPENASDTFYVIWDMENSGFLTILNTTEPNISKAYRMPNKNFAESTLARLNPFNHHIYLVKAEYTITRSA